jgi:hypothetical protein
VNCIRKKASVITTTSCKNIEDIFVFVLNSPTNNQANIDDCVSKDEGDERYVILGVRTKWLEDWLTLNLLFGVRLKQAVQAE